MRKTTANTRFLSPVLFFIFMLCVSRCFPCGEGELKHEKQHLLERMDLIRCRKAYVSIDDDAGNMCVLEKKTLEW